VPGVLLFTGPYEPPFDEGVKLFAHHLVRGLGEIGEVSVATTAERAPAGATIIPRKPWAFLAAMRRLCRSVRPDALVYVPDAYLDRYTLARCGLLRLAAGRIPIGMVTLQPGTIDLAVRVMIRLWRPDVVFAVTDTEADLYRRHGVALERLPPAVDAERFRPAASPAEKEALRRQYGLPAGGKVCLHVGHIRRSRNIDWLLRLNLPDDVRLVVVGSRSRALEEDMKQALLGRGAIVPESYLPAIEELYRAADVYLFPVTQDRAAIGMPLSVLEAMASNLRVVSTPFGGLADHFRGVPGLYYAGTPEEFQRAALEALRVEACGTRAAVERYTWQGVASLVRERLRR